MRVAVTGASGFVGGRVAEMLMARGDDVLAYGRRPGGACRLHGQVAYHSWDIRSGPLQDPHVDAVVHCAAKVDDWGPPQEFLAVNVHGTRHVLQTFASAKRIVHISTASVYEPTNTLTGLREDAPTGGPGMHPYGATKNAAEDLIRADGRPSVLLRPHVVYGPGDTTVLPRLLAARRLGYLPMIGSGRNRISITHVDNLALAVELALREPSTGTFNVSDGVDAPLLDVLRTIFTRLGLPFRPVRIPLPVAWGIAGISEVAARVVRVSTAPTLTRFRVAHLAKEFTLDISHARQQLAYEPRWSIHDAPLEDQPERRTTMHAG